MGFGKIKKINGKVKKFDLKAKGGSGRNLFDVSKNIPKIPTGGIGNVINRNTTFGSIGMKEGNRLERIAKRGKA